MPLNCFCCQISLKKTKKYRKAKCPHCNRKPSQAILQITNDGELRGFCECGYKLWDHFDPEYGKCYCVECRNYKYSIDCSMH